MLILTTALMLSIPPGGLPEQDRAELDPLRFREKAPVVEFQVQGRTILINKHHGGVASTPLQRVFWRAQGWKLQINGECYSNCTLLAEHLPSCVTENAALGYHQALNTKTGEFSDISHLYRPDLVESIDALGGFPAASDKVTVLKGETLLKFFDKCGE